MNVKNEMCYSESLTSPDEFAKTILNFSYWLDKQIWNFFLQKKKNTILKCLGV